MAIVYKPTLKQIESLTDPLIGCNYNLFFSGVPVGFFSSVASWINSITVDTFGLTPGRPLFGMSTSPVIFSTTRMDVLGLRCKGVSLSETTIEPVHVEHKGFKTAYPGRCVQTGSVSLEFYEGQDMVVDTIMRMWMKHIRNNDNTNAGGSKKSITATQLCVMTVKADGTFSSAYYFSNLWPATLGAIGLSGSNRDAVSLTVDFCYDQCLKDWAFGDIWVRIFG